MQVQNLTMPIKTKNKTFYKNFEATIDFIRSEFTCP